jgi:hypothetical protein
MNLCLCCRCLVLKPRYKMAGLDELGRLVCVQCLLNGMRGLFLKRKRHAAV